MWICFSYHYLPLTRLSYLFHSKLRNSLYIYYYIIVTDMKGNAKRTDCSRIVEMISPEQEIAWVIPCPKGNVSILVLPKQEMSWSIP